MYNERSRPLAIVSAVFLGLAILMTAVRFYVRGHMLKSLKMDDWLMLGALFGLMVIVGFIQTGCALALGKPLSEIPIQDARTTFIGWWIAYQIYALSISAARVSVALLFLRLTVQKYYRWFLYKSIYINIATGSAFFLVAIFRCKPVDYFWNHVVPGTTGHCPIDGRVMGLLGYLYGVVCIITDFGYFFYPFALFWAVRMDFRTKAAMVMLLSLSGAAASGPLVRMFYMHTLWSEELLRDSTDVLLWTVVETGLAIIASSFATLRPLMQSISARRDAKSLTTPPPGTVPSFRHWGRGIKHGIRTITVTKQATNNTTDDFDLERNAYRQLGTPHLPLTNDTINSMDSDLIKSDNLLALMTNCDESNVLNVQATADPLTITQERATLKSADVFP